MRGRFHWSWVLVGLVGAVMIAGCGGSGNAAGSTSATPLRSLTSVTDRVTLDTVYGNTSGGGSASEAAVWAQAEFGLAQGLFVSNFDGHTGRWGKPHQLTSSSPSGLQPAVSVAQSGEVVVVWQSGTGELEGEFKQGGRPSPWSRPLSIADVGLSPASIALATDPAGDATVVWAQTGVHGAWTVKTATLVLPDNAWSKPQLVAAGRGANYVLANIAIGSYRRAAVTWLTVPSSGQAGQISLSLRAGLPKLWASAVWSAPEAVGSAQQPREVGGPQAAPQLLSYARHELIAWGTMTSVGVQSTRVVWGRLGRWIGHALMSPGTVLSSDGEQVGAIWSATAGKRASRLEFSQLSLTKRRWSRPSTLPGTTGASSYSLSMAGAVAPTVAFVTPSRRLVLISKSLVNGPWQSASTPIAKQISSLQVLALPTNGTLATWLQPAPRGHSHLISERLSSLFVPPARYGG